VRGSAVDLKWGISVGVPFTPVGDPASRLGAVAILMVVGLLAAWVVVPLPLAVAVGRALRAAGAEYSHHPAPALPTGRPG
jgi:hypothetical protein